MTKWADWLISAVSYDDDHSEIKKVKRHRDNGESVGSAEITYRWEVVSDIEDRITYCTIYMRNDKWQKGEDVRVIEVNNKKYIRTDANKTEKDNLGELPEFE